MVRSSLPEPIIGRNEGLIERIAARTAAAKSAVKSRFKIVIDDRESRGGYGFEPGSIDELEAHLEDDHKDPYRFDSIVANSRYDYRPVDVQTCVRRLETGDYSILGLERLVVVERKSLSDVFGSLAGKNGERRERFKAEHERMQNMILWGGFAHVVIEASRDDARNNPPSHGACFNQVLSTSISWPMTYGVHWHWAGSKSEAEKLTYELLEHAWRVLRKEMKPTK